MLKVVFVDLWCVMKVEGWFECIAIIMVFDFLLELIFYRKFDRIVFFLQKLSLKLFFRCDELSFWSYSIVVFFNQFLEIFAQL